MTATLEITTVSSCSVRCAICPQDVLKDAYRKDSDHRLTLFRFVRALRTVPLHVRIDFSGLVEPWLNPDCTAMLEHALGMGYRVAVYTTLVGMHDVKRTLRILRAWESRVDVVCIHEADGVNMPAQDVDADAFVAGLGSEIRVERMKMGGPAFEAIDRAGNVVSLNRALKRKGPIMCSYTDTYDHNVMLPNGDVHLCCMDYGLRHKLGNLIEQSWVDIQAGVEKRKIKSANEGDGDTLCRRCHGAKS